jgi:hypothetical protein
MRFFFVSLQVNYILLIIDQKKKTLINVSGEIAASFFFFWLTRLVVGGRMLYRPLLLLLLLILLHSSFNVKHLTMNSFAPMMVYILFLPFFSLLFYFECMLLFGLFIGQTVILGVKEENIAHILSILISTCRCGDVGNHLRSSPLFYILSFRSKVVVMPFPRVSRLVCVLFLLFFSPLSLSIDRSLCLAGKNTKWYHHIIPIVTSVRHIFCLSRFFLPIKLPRILSYKTIT